MLSKNFIHQNVVLNFLNKFNLTKIKKYNKDLKFLKFYFNKGYIKGSLYSTTTNGYISINFSNQLVDKKKIIKKFSKNLDKKFYLVCIETENCKLSIYDENEIKIIKPYYKKISLNYKSIIDINENNNFEFTELFFKSNCPSLLLDKEINILEIFDNLYIVDPFLEKNLILMEQIETKN